MPTITQQPARLARAETILQQKSRAKDERHTSANANSCLIFDVFVSFEVVEVEA